MDDERTKGAFRPSHPAVIRTRNIMPYSLHTISSPQTSAGISNSGPLHWPSKALPKSDIQASSMLKASVKYRGIRRERQGHAMTGLESLLRRGFIFSPQHRPSQRSTQLGRWKEFQKVGAVIEEMRRIGRETYVVEMGVGSTGTKS